MQLPEPAILIGILAGFGAAFFQAASYFFSRRFLTECHAGSRALFSISHVQMGLAAAVVFPFLLRGALPPIRSFAWPLVATSGLYLGGQWLLFTVLKTTESSVVAPLLGLKIPLLGIISAFVLGTPLTPGAWGAIGLCTAAAFLVSPLRGVPEIRAFLLVLLICLLYSGSDLHIPVLVERIDAASRVPALLGVSMSYIVCGLVGLPIALQQGAFRIKGAARYTLPYSFCWLASMCCLFAAFSLIGVIFGNMLQSSRGFLSVLLGVAVSHLGLHHIEARITRRSWLIRCTGAALMTVAIVLYYSFQLRG